MFVRSFCSACRLGLLLAMVLAFGQVAPAADVPARRNFDVPANDALVSLKQFAEQCGQEIIYPDTVKGTPTKAVHGNFTSREALDVMLAGTGLVATQAKSGALAVNPVPDPNNWFHARIEIKSPEIKVFVNNSKTPSLIVQQLSNRKEGKLGLWIDSKDGWFKNVVISEVK